MNKKSYLVFGVVILLVLLGTYIFFRDYSTTAFVVFSEDDGITLPQLQEGVEVNFNGLKYKDSGGIVVSTEPVVSCRWKDPKNDDGWKECEAIFEIQDLRSERQRLENPNINFNFKEQNYRNVDISYSTDYDIVSGEFQTSFVESETYKILINESNESENNRFEELSFGITGKAIEEGEGGELKKVYHEDERIIAVHRNIPVTKREFKKFDSFSSSPIEEVVEIKFDEVIEEEALEQEEIVEDIVNLEEENIEISIINETSRSINLTDENETNGDVDEIVEEEDVNDNESEINILDEDSGNEIVEEEDVNNSGSLISGFAISQESEGGIFGRVSINTKKPFAVRVIFEIPKYSTNQFDFEIASEGFDADIDPIISGCGTLDTANSVYTMDQDVSSTGSCFIIDADNVTLDCMGNMINFSTAGTSGQGVYSIYDYSTVKNCVIVSGNQTTASGKGIVFSNLDHAVALNNSIFLYLASTPLTTETGILLQSSSNVLIENNTVSVTGDVPYGFYIQTSEVSNVLRGNTIVANTDSGGNSYGIYSDSNSNWNTIEDNYLSISSTNKGYGTFLDNMDGLTIRRNIYNISGEEGYGLYSDSSSRISFKDNSVSHGANSGSAVHLVYESGGISIDNNSISTSGGSAYGTYVEEGTGFNITHNSITSSGYEGHCIYLSSSTGVVLGNDLTTTGESAYGVGLILSSVESKISENIINTNGSDSYGVSTFSYSTDNNFSDNLIFTSGSTGNGIYFETESNFASNNLVNTSGIGGIGAYINDADFNNLISNEIYTYGENSYGIYLDSGSNNNLIDSNIVSTYDGSGYGIMMEGTSGSNSYINNSVSTFGIDSYPFDISSSYNNFENNTLLTYGRDCYGYYLEGENVGNQFSGGEILTYGERSHGIIFGVDSFNLSINSMNIRTVNDSAHAIYSQGSRQTVNFVDGILETEGEGSFGLYLDQYTTSSSWNFTNVSFNQSYWKPGAVGDLNVQWYLEVHSVYDNSTNAGGTNVTTYNSSDDLIGTELSDDSGFIKRQILYSYSKNASSTSYSGGYTVSGVSPDNQTDAVFVNLTTNQLIDLQFEGTTAVVNESVSSGGGGGGGGSGITNELKINCKNEWICTSWSSCDNGIQARTCVDEIPSCGVPMPIEERRCGKGKKDNLFDIILDLPRQILDLGEKPLISLTLINLGTEGSVDAILYYKITDGLDNLVYEETEAQEVETQLEFIKRFDDLDLVQGQYKILVDLSYDGQEYPAQAEGTFSVGEPLLSPEVLSWKSILSFGITAGILFVIILTGFLMMKKKKEELVKADENDEEFYEPELAK